MSLRGITTEEKIWNYLKDKINNIYGVAGLMGNLYAESALDPKNLQNSYEKKLGYTNATYTAAVDCGSYTNFIKDCAGYGLAQWTYWSRKQNLLNYAKSTGRSIGDLEMQLDFLYKELNEGYTPVLNTLKSATSVRQASDAVLIQYERPADQSESAQAKRASYGQKYYDKYATNSQTELSIDMPITIKEYKRGEDIQLSKNFHLREFTCKCGKCEKVKVDLRLVAHLQAIRDHFSDKVNITSGNRCEAHNVAVDGAKGSYHVKGQAADIKAKGVTPSEVAKYAESIGMKGIGLYPNFTHVDTRTNKSFWYGSSQEKRTTFGGTPEKVQETKTIDSIAYEVLEGKWGNGQERKKKVEAAGYDYSKVQELVNLAIGTKSGVFYDGTISGTYMTTANLNIRAGAGTGYLSKGIIPKGTKVKCHGYFKTVDGTKWLFVCYLRDNVLYYGFSSGKYLSK